MLWSTNKKSYVHHHTINKYMLVFTENQRCRNCHPTCPFFKKKKFKLLTIKRHSNLIHQINQQQKNNTTRWTILNKRLSGHVRPGPVGSPQWTPEHSLALKIPFGFVQTFRPLCCEESASFPCYRSLKSPPSRKKKKKFVLPAAHSAYSMRQGKEAERFGRDTWLLSPINSSHISRGSPE